MGISDKTKTRHDAKMGTALKIWKKPIFRKICWILVGLAVASIIIVLLAFYKPAGYQTPKAEQGNQPSQYVTNVLLPHIYNNAQLEQPFDVTIVQERVADIVNLTKWPKESGGIVFSAPKADFAQDGIVFMTTAVIRGFEFVITIVVKPHIEQNQLLSLRIVKVKIGAIRATFIVKAIARRIYARHVTPTNTDAGDIWTQMTQALLNDESFEAVFKTADEKLRIEKITVTADKLTVRLIPIVE